MISDNYKVSYSTYDAPSRLQGYPEDWWGPAITMYASLHNGKYKDLDVTPWFKPSMLGYTAINMAAAIDIAHFWESNSSLAELMLGAVAEPSPKWTHLYDSTGWGLL